MDEKDWLLLKTLYEKKSITKAAATLFVSQPSLSSRIQQIEERFGATVVLRGKKGVQFTPEGEVLAKCAYDVLKQIRLTEEQIENMRMNPAGTLRVGASNFFTKYLLPEVLRQFKLLYPKVEFKVVTGWSKDVVNQVQNNDVHVGFVRGDYPWPGEKTLLFEEHMYVTYYGPLELANLPALPQITYRNDHSIQVMLDAWWNEHYDAPPYIGMEVDRVATCKEMVAKGLGYAFLPELILKGEDPAYRHLMRYKSGEPLRRKTWMFTNKQAQELKLVKLFCDFVKNFQFL